MIDDVARHGEQGEHTLGVLTDSPDDRHQRPDLGGRTGPQNLACLPFDGHDRVGIGARPTRATSRYSSMSPAPGIGVDQLIHPLWASHSATQLPSAVYTNGPKPQRDLVRSRIERLIARPAFLPGELIDDDEGLGPRLVGDRRDEDRRCRGRTRRVPPSACPPLVARLRVEGDTVLPSAEQHRAVAVDLLDRAPSRSETQLAGRRVVDLEVRLVTDHDDFVVGVDGSMTARPRAPTARRPWRCRNGSAGTCSPTSPRGGVLVQVERVAGDGDVAPAWEDRRPAASSAAESQATACSQTSAG